MKKEKVKEFDWWAEKERMLQIEHKDYECKIEKLPKKERPEGRGGFRIMSEKVLTLWSKLIMSEVEIDLLEECKVQRDEELEELKKEVEKLIVIELQYYGHRKIIQGIEKKLKAVGWLEVEADKLDEEAEEAMRNNKELLKRLV